MNNNMKKKSNKVFHTITPANNMVLKQKWDQIRYDIHRSKVRNAKAVIDNQLPAIYLNAQSNLKKQQMEAERKAIIKRENRLLLEKISNIMNSACSYSMTRNDHSRKKKLVPSPTTLNKTFRERELIRIAQENKALAQRIQSKQPHYSHTVWLEQWERNRKYMTNLCKLPPYKKTKFIPESLQISLAAATNEKRSLVPSTV